MRMKVSDLLYISWKEIPLRKMKLILQILPLIKWEAEDGEQNTWGNTYLKNFLLKQLFKKRSLYLRTSPEQRVDLYSQELDWIQKPTHKFLTPSIVLSKIEFFAPKDGLTDLSVEQLAEADTRLSRFMISQRTDYLHSFLACLYSDGSEFNEENILINAAILAKMPEFEQVAIIRSYFGSRQLLTASCPDLFPSHPENTEKNKSKKPSFTVQDTGPMWNSLIYELSATPGFPGVATAKAANAWEALQYLNHEIKKTSTRKSVSHH